MRATRWLHSSTRLPIGQQCFRRSSDNDSTRRYCPLVSTLHDVDSSKRHYYWLIVITTVIMAPRVAAGYDRHPMQVAPLIAGIARGRESSASHGDSEESRSAPAG
jgi:hypothetical protein